MSIRHKKMNNWKAVCPKCDHVECSEGSGAKCENCDAPVIMTYGTCADGFIDESARQSWRQIQCSKKCGWSVNQITCSKCGAIIQGDYFKGDKCFVATSAFNNENHPTVVQLRYWRDHSLVHSEIGRMFINWYYANGEKISLRLESAPRFKPLIRFLLNSFVRLLQNSKDKNLY